MDTNKTKKKILIFSTAYYPFVGGAEVAIKEITDRIGNDFEFDLITAKLRSDLSSVEKIGSVTVYRIGSGHSFFDKLLLPFRGAFLTHKLNKKQKYFCMWGVMVTFSSLSGYIFNLFNREKIPMILTLQEGDSELHLRFKWFGLIGLSWKLVLRRTSLLTGISNFLLERAKKEGYKRESVLVPNGVDISIFTKEVSEETKSKIKSLLGKKEDEVFLVTTGRLTHKNATDDIISSLPSLPEKITLVVIGKGDEGPNLQKQATRLGVENRVKFLGFVEYKDMPDYLAICDVFIRPSRSEGFGNSFIEAMAARLPVIATPVGGIVDFIDDKETGVFCSPDNPQSIAKAVNLILEDKSLKDRIVANAHARVVERYSWDHVAMQMKSVFDRVS